MRSSSKRRPTIRAFFGLIIHQVSRKYKPLIMSRLGLWGLLCANMKPACPCEVETNHGFARLGSELDHLVCAHKVSQPTRAKLKLITVSQQV